jgi:hypothetical protein
MKGQFSWGSLIDGLTGFKARNSRTVLSAVPRDRLVVAKINEIAISSIWAIKSNFSQ